MYNSYFSSPVGNLKIVTNETHLLELGFLEEEIPVTTAQNTNKQPRIIKEVLQQLAEYFAGSRNIFTIPIHFERGTDFQKEVWLELTKIPYSKIISYGEQARRIGRDKAYRAVGLTNGKNPIAIIVPCHRVIGANGKLTGYASGLWRKEWLLQHEQKYA